MAVSSSSPRLLPGRAESFWCHDCKKGVNKWRLIVDLSSPHDASVNDGIDSAYASIHYSYRSVPVHPDDRLLLGTRWGDSIFVDTALPFGLASAPKIFSAVADA